MFRQFASLTPSQKISTRTRLLAMPYALRKLVSTASQHKARMGKQFISPTQNDKQLHQPPAPHLRLLVSPTSRSLLVVEPNLSEKLYNIAAKHTPLAVIMPSSSHLRTTPHSSLPPPPVSQNSSPLSQIN